MSLTDKFKSNYLRGFDCRLSTFRNSLACNDIVISNAMALGLSGSLIFCCNNGNTFKKLEIALVAGVSDQSLEGLAARTNSYIFNSVFDINDDWKFEIETYLSQNIPVNVAINRVRLQQICKDHEFNNPFFVNMGFHFVTITNYDRKRDVFTLFETDSAMEILLSSDDLKEIWFYDVMNPRQNRDLLQSCNGQWYAILVGKADEEFLISGALHAIHKVICNFYNAPHNKIMGINALQTFESAAHSWYSPNNNPELIGQTIRLLSLISNNLTGGGMGRKLYSYFLNELSSKLQNEALKEVSFIFKKTSALWTAFVTQLNQSIDYRNGSHHIDFSVIKNAVDDYVHEIVAAEKNQMKMLNEWYRSKTYE